MTKYKYMHAPCPLRLNHPRVFALGGTDAKFAPTPSRQSRTKSSVVSFQPVGASFRQHRIPHPHPPVTPRLEKPALACQVYLPMA